MKETTLKELLEDALITQAELADKMEVTRATVSRWVAGDRMPAVPYIRKMVSILELPKEKVLAAIRETMRLAKHTQACVAG